MTETIESKNVYKKTLAALLRSLVRFCIRRSIKIQEFEEILKEAYLKEAREFLRENNIEENASKISVITGIQRFAVSKLSLPEESAPSRGVDLVTKVIGQWQTDRKFIRSDGKPKVLRVEGKESDFADLVRSVSSALNPYTVLFELERSGIIERNNKGGIKLKYGSNLSNGDISRGMEYYSADFEDLSEAIEENLFAGSKNCRNHHLTTEFDSIPESNREKAAQLLMEEGSKFHARLRKILAKLSAKATGSNPVRTDSFRIALCSFSRIHRI